MSKIMRIINVKFRMLKLFGGLFVALFALVIMAGQIYADSGTWVDGNFPALSAGRLTA